MQLKIISNPAVAKKIEQYPSSIQEKLHYLRQLILDTATEIEELTTLEETLKWGEPSYLAKKGSTIRIDWKPATPKQYAIYFKCTSKLVVTFKVLYPKQFKFEKTRAILFSLEEEIPVKELKHCIQLALQYHKVKHLPLLGTRPTCK